MYFKLDFMHVLFETKIRLKNEIKIANTPHRPKGKKGKENKCFKSNCIKLCY